MEEIEWCSVSSSDKRPDGRSKNTNHRGKQNWKELKFISFDMLKFKLRMKIVVRNSEATKKEVLQKPF